MKAFLTAANEKLVAAWVWATNHPALVSHAATAIVAFGLGAWVFSCR